MKPLFQRQCEALVKTLTKARADENARLNMRTWVDEKHPCGTAACVCGYQALSNDLSLFNEAMKADEYGEDYDEVSRVISDDLKISCYELFGNERLARSIYMASARSRFYKAKYTNVAEQQTLVTFNHLTSREPSLDDAIEYIEFVIQKCKEQAA